MLTNTRVAEDAASHLASRSYRAGTSTQLERGDGGELNALKEFTTGSDRRMIDWKQSARHGGLLTREYRAERSTRILLAVDTGRVMSEPVAGTPRVDHGVTAALAVAYAALRGGDQVGLLAFDAIPRVASGLTSGAHAFNSLQRLATTIGYSNEETDFAAGMLSILERFERRGIVIIFTDFSDSHAAGRMVGGLASLSVRHMVLFVAFRDVDVARIADGEPETKRDVARAVVAGAMLRERRLVFDRVRRLGAHVVEVDPKEATPRLLARYMQAKREFTR